MCRAHYEVICHIFNYYATMGDGDCFAIKGNAYLEFLEQTRIPDATNPKCGMKDLDTIFVVTNVVEDMRSAESQVNLARALMRFEFLEILVRIALAKYHNERTTKSLVAAFDMLVEENLIARLPMVIQHDPNTWRKSRLYKEEVHDVLSKWLPKLRPVLTRFASLQVASSQKRSELQIDEWVEMLAVSRLLDNVRCCQPHARMMLTTSFVRRHLHSAKHGWCTPGAA